MLHGREVENAAVDMLAAALDELTVVASSRPSDIRVTIAMHPGSALMMTVVGGGPRACRAARW